MPSGRYRNIRILAAFLLGGLVLGGAAGVGVAMAIGWISMLANPQDPSAGSGAIIVIATFPLGMLFGLVVGARASERYKKKSSDPRGFEVMTKGGRRRPEQ